MAVGPTYIGGVDTGQIGPEDLGSLDTATETATVLAILTALENLGLVTHTEV